MAAFSDAAFDTGAFSNLAFSFGTGPAPAPTPAPAEPSRGRQLWLYPPRTRKEEEKELRRRRIAYGVIEEVAEAVVEQVSLDKVQREQLLAAEFKARGLELRAEHLERLNAERERLLDAEIARYMAEVLRRRMADEDAAAILIAIAAALD